MTFIFPVSYLRRQRRRWDGHINSELKWDVKMWTGDHGLVMVSRPDYSDINELSGFIKCGEFRDRLGCYHARRTLTGRRCDWAGLLLHIIGVPVSKFVPESDYTEWDFPWFSPRKCLDSRACLKLCQECVLPYPFSTARHTIRRYRLWAADSVGKQTVLNKWNKDIASWRCLR
jgi:hypothetical protein